MASHLHIYINGTPGEKDGTELDITKPLELITNTYKVLLSNSNPSYISQMGSYPILFIPLCFRCESGYKVNSATLKIFYSLNENCFIGGLATGPYSSNPIKLFKTIDEINTYMQSNQLYLNAGGYSDNNLIIDESNAITDVNSTVMLCVVNHGEIPQTINNAFDLIEFSFSETAVTP